MKLTLNVNVAPLTLNRMFGGKFSKSSGYKSKYYSALALSLESAGIIELANKIHTKSHLQLLKKSDVSDNAIWFEKIKENKKTGIDEVSKRYIQLKEPLFVKPNATWLFFFNTNRRRDKKNLIGGLKWLEDCMVDMNILTDDSFKDYDVEKFPNPTIEPGKESRIQIILEEEKENGK